MVISLFKSRVRKIGALAILGLLVGVLMMLTGHPWVVVILTPLLGLIGDFLYSKGKKGFNILAYALFSLWYVTPWFPVLTDAAGYRQMITFPRSDFRLDGLYLPVGANRWDFRGVGFGAPLP